MEKPMKLKQVACAAAVALASQAYALDAATVNAAATLKVTRTPQRRPPSMVKRRNSRYKPFDRSAPSLAGRHRRGQELLPLAPWF